MSPEGTERELIYSPVDATQSSKVLGYSLTVSKLLIKPRPGPHVQQQKTLKNYGH